MNNPIMGPRLVKAAVEAPDQTCGECVKFGADQACDEWGVMVAPTQKACGRFLGQDGAGIGGFKPVMTVSIADRRRQREAAASKAVPVLEKQKRKERADIKQVYEKTEDRALERLDRKRVEKREGEPTTKRRYQSTAERPITDEEIRRVAEMYNEQKTIHEIVDEMGMSATLIYRRIHRARQLGLIKAGRRFTRQEMDDQAREVAKMKADGLSNSEIALEIGLSDATVRNRLDRATRLKASDEAESVKPDTDNVAEEEAVSKPERASIQADKQADKLLDRRDLRSLSGEELRDLYRDLMIEMGRRYAEEAV